MSQALKNIERSFKALSIRLLAKVMAAPDGTSGARPPVPDWAAGPHRVLYLRYDRIGDMVLATGIIKAITAAQPTVTVDVLASPANARVLLDNPHVGRVLTFDRKRRGSYLLALRAMRRERYDAVIDAMVMAPSLTTMLLMWASGARTRIGVGDRGNEYALTLPVPRLNGALHYIDHSAALLTAFGVDPVAEHRAHPVPTSRVRSLDGDAAGTDAGMPSSGWDIWRPEIFLSDAERAGAETFWSGAGSGRQREAKERGESRRFVVNVSAGAAHRYWAESRFIEVIARITERFPGALTVIIGSPEDGERMDRIAGAAGATVARTPDYRQNDGARRDGGSRTHRGHIGHAHRVRVRHAGCRDVCERLSPALRPLRHDRAHRPTPGRTLESLEAEPVARALEAVAAGELAAGQDVPGARARGAVEGPVTTGAKVAGASSTVSAPGGGRSH